MWRGGEDRPLRQAPKSLSKRTRPGGQPLVVMAAHDPRITDYLIGSNAAHVVLHAPCSVLVVR